jgi:2-keto-4-pentenoate hydratase/2-oxohepta-3-ene-1,7-dioic acid hydratase in catechol pathway
MKIVLFGFDARVGALDGGEIVDLNAADPSIPATLAEFIAAGPEAIGAAKRAIARGGPRHSAAGIKLHAPWPRKRIVCAGGNFAAHSYGMALSMGREGVTLETQAKRIRDDGLWGFWKNLDEVAGPGATIPYPKRARYFDYEGEVAIVIGKRGKDIPADRIAEYVWGVTLAIDWSVRDGEKSPQRPVSFNLQKNFDFAASLGPCIVVGEVDPSDLAVETRVDGDLRQQYNNKDMVFSYGELLAHLSRDFTFVPGDIIFGGTGAGTAQDSTKVEADGTRSLDRFLRPGQVVEVSSPGIGKLTGTIA